MRVFICINLKINTIPIDDSEYIDSSKKCFDKMKNSYLIYYEYMINHELFHVVRSIILWILIFIYVPYLDIVRYNWITYLGWACLGLSLLSTFF